ncbi:MAG: hypothetical protein JWQ87_5464 [Candidatus Sulfotelmatobacter sp.]|nr:hypothetical protein [Candidatus Sulfotelmatobacter sp.]
MAQRFNPQSVVITSAAATVTVIKNPSTTAFLYVWEFVLVCGGATNLTLNNAWVGGVSPITGAMAMLANGSIMRQDNNNPWYTIDPGASFTITNSGSVQLSGSCKYSN